MRLAIVFMKYPYPSETFAGRDVRAYESLGIEVETHDLKTVDSPVQYLRDLFGALTGSPGIVEVARLAASLVREPGWDRVQRLKTLALLPSAAVVAHRLQKSQPDVIHLFWGHYPALVAELCQSTVPSARQSIFLGAYDLWLQLPISKRVARRLGHVFTHAHGNLEELHSFLGPDVEASVVHRGIELDQYPLSEVTVAIRQPRVLAVGRLVDVKGFDDVISAFAQVAEARPDAELVIAGDGPDRERLEAMVSELDLSNSVTFLGWIPESDMPDLLMGSRVSVLLSRKPGERLPNGLKEAMAAGCVVVTTPTPGIEELVDSGEDGFIVSQGDINAAAEAILRGLEVEESAAMSSRAIETVRSGFDARRSAEQYVEHWQGELSALPR